MFSRQITPTLRWILRAAFALVCVATLAGTRVPAQPRKGDAPAKDPSRTEAGPSRGDAILQREERPATQLIVRTVIKEVKVGPNNGALVMWLTAGAHVGVTPLLQNKPGKPLSFDLGRSNKLTLQSLSPGKYQVKVTHPDFDPYTETIVIGRGEVVPLLPPLISKYGSVIVGGAPKGSKVALDGRDLARSDYETDEQGRIVINRVGVGTHELKVSQTGYDDWTSKVEVKPGEPTPVAALTKAATVTLNVRVRQGARVYLDDVERGEVPSSGVIVIPGLAPGQHRLQVLLGGFEPLARELALTLKERSPVVELELAPIAESSEAAINDNNPRLNWTPNSAGWLFDKQGIHVRGDATVLFKGANETRQFSYYRDFTVHLDLSLAGGRGAAWVVRAQDAKNFYMFELTTKDGRRMLNFYICKGGVLEFVDGRLVVDDIANPKAFLHVTTEARGNRFIHKIEVSTDAKRQPRPLGDFTDKAKTFEVGGIGFRGADGMEPVIYGLHVIPAK